MGDIRGFLKVKRDTAKHRPASERVEDYRDVVIAHPDEHTCGQASRCMDCGTPFCHWGCPVGNYIPEWNDLVFRGKWEKALDLLEATNNLPEITGRLCPAHCEYACVLGINDDPVTIRENELAIIEHGFNSGYIKPKIPKKRTGRRIAVVGSGPAGLTAADQLNKAGHEVTVFEKDEKSGGILRYGIPDFKLEKWVIDRRIGLLKREGIKFVTGVNVGFDYDLRKMKKDFDAICLAGGSRTPRDLLVEGRHLKGIHFAMDYLVQSNKRVAGEKIPGERLIDTKGKKVVIIGGGDTGADCVGVANRQGADRVVQIELLPQPSECRTGPYPWPKYPVLLKTSTSHEEGCERHWSISTKKFIGEGGCIKSMSCAKMPSGADFEIEADLVILAMGFLHPDKKGPVEGLRLELDRKGNVKTGDDYMTSLKGVFSAGDMRRGQSLVVWAISEGRRAAHCIDRYLMGSSDLPLV